RRASMRALDPAVQRVVGEALALSAPACRGQLPARVPAVGKGAVVRELSVGVVGEMRRAPIGELVVLVVRGRAHLIGKGRPGERPSYGDPLSIGVVRVGQITEGRTSLCVLHGVGPRTRVVMDAR